MYSKVAFDSLQIEQFYSSYPDLVKYEKDVKIIYRGHNYHEIWYDEQGVIEFANTIYHKVKGIAVEGIYGVFPYNDKIDGIFEVGDENQLSQAETDIMLTNLFLYYAEKVYKGVDDKTAAATEWLLPKKQVSYETLLDSLIQNQDLLARNDSVLLVQYYLLRDKLKYFRDVQKNGGWDSIMVDPKFKSFKRGDTANAIVQIRKRLFITGELKENNNSNLYDESLLLAVNRFQDNNLKKVQPLITRELINRLNTPVNEYIKKIAVNMERWRWVSPELAYSKEFVFVNIPSYLLQVNRNGVKVFESPVVVGKTMSKTVIFSGNMSNIVFSPYWNIPTSILNSEVLPGIKKDKNYLAKHNMEWNNGQVRQKPGKNNSLGLVKFLFPNSNNIYLHDTPAKSLFGRDSRAFSPGCIRVGRPRDLAIEILRNDTAWTPQKIDVAMHSGKEVWVKLKEKIPVYIGYFTCFVNEKGEFRLFEDIYDMDDRLFDILIGYEEEPQLTATVTG
jgi:murein L,D-transpeptidase YcbB/YkuD